MKTKKPTKDEMLNLLGNTILTYSMCHERSLELQDNVPSAAVVIGFMCGRDNLWMAACTKFIESNKNALEKSSAIRDSDAERASQYGKEIKNVYK